MPKSRLSMFLLALLVAVSAFAQTVRELVPSSAPPGARLMVTGRGLDDPAIAVTFAPDRNANVVARSDRFIEVVVPRDAVTGSVRVTLGSTVLAELPFTLASEPRWIVSTLAGGPRAQNNPFKHPWGAAVVLPGGDIAVADEQHDAIELVTPSGAVSVLASGPFKAPRGITFDSARNVLYVSDSGHGVIRRVTLDGVVTTIAGGFKDPCGLTVARTARSMSPTRRTTSFAASRSKET